jgi:hypothetical protein
MISSASQGSPWFVWCWYLAWHLLLGSMKTLVDWCQMPNDAHMVWNWNVEPQFNCHDKCIMWRLYQVLLLRCWECCRLILLSGSYILGADMCLCTCLFLPLCIHGNRCSLDQLAADEQCLVMFIDNQDHCKAHISMSVIFVNQSVLESNLNCIPVPLWWSSREVYKYSTRFSSYAVFATFSFYWFFLLWQSLTITIWYMEPYWYFTA